MECGTLHEPPEGSMGTWKRQVASAGECAKEFLQQR